MKIVVCITVLLILAGAHAHAQAGVLGSVPASDARVTAPSGDVLAVSGGTVSVAGIDTVTAKPGRNAELTLTRGGSVLVCQTSGLHLAGSNSGPMLLALDRGAMEIRMKAEDGDVLMTPDLRFTMTGGGTLDLRLRVSFNGDTCVENRGRKAPLLKISDAFGEASYEVKPGQHVLFEHGSLREVVDRETTPCGCPSVDPTRGSIADAMLNGGGKTTPKQAEATHPFPAAVSEGLAVPDPVAPETPAGGTHVQVATTLAYDPNVPMPADPAARQPTAAIPTPASTQTGKHGPLAAIGRLFHRIFAR